MSDTKDDVRTIEDTVDTYLGMWNEEDPARRTGLIEAAWSGDGRYADPVQEAVGHEALHAMVDGIHQKLPGHRFVRTSGIDVHHDELRFGRRLEGTDGTVAVEGVDVGAVDGDGRLTRITGFFGPLPEDG